MMPLLVDFMGAERFSSLANAGMEDNALWNEVRSAYLWFVCVLASGQRPALDGME
jgi:hypothetical protein